MNHKSVFVTGGSGYIGRHVVWSLIKKGFSPIIFDIRKPPPPLFHRTPFICGDIRSGDDLHRAFSLYTPACVIHLAAKTSVKLSRSSQEELWNVNIIGSRNVLAVMRQYKCRRIVFSSSAAVYGNAKIPVSENTPTNPVSIYGKSKETFEDMLRRSVSNNDVLAAAIVRLFNVAGIDERAPFSLDIGRATLLANALRCVKTHKTLTIYGEHLPTRDGTAIRDYVNIEDVTRAIVQITDRSLNKPGCLTVNIGSGKGTSNLEVVRMVERASGVPLQIRYTPKRSGEIIASVADISRAKKELHWFPRISQAEDIVLSLVRAYA